ncbi:NUDIX hydrolase domain-like protein [Trametes elegans]|nr:NUDIX hydrolase domain-like protein [Trametes elegans]
MGEAYVNFLGGSPLNRLSWLRTSQPFLNAIVHAPATRWLVFNDGQPLVHTQHGRDPSKPSLARLSTDAVRPLLGPEPFFAQGEHEGALAPAPAGVPVLEAARLRGAPVVFLGLHETDSAGGALPSSDFSAKADAQAIIANIKGTPFFTLDVSEAAPADIDRVLRAAGPGLAFSEPRTAMGTFDAFEAALFAEGRSMTDWNARNKFCPSCGSAVYSLWAGWKISCSTLLPWADKAGKKPCATARGLHNFTHPRTDAVVIMAVIDESGDKILLGRNKKWPIKFYSCPAGFIEPGESFEDAVRRELWEEAGVKVWDVRYHSTQPWPFPANLMVGFYATASSAAPLRTDLDNELEDARWYTRAEIRAILAHRAGTTLSSRDHSTLAAAAEKSNPNAPGASAASPTACSGAGTGTGAGAGASAAAAVTDEPPFKLPPVTAIAGVLISEWAHGRAGFQPPSGAGAEAGAGAGAGAGTTTRGNL